MSSSLNTYSNLIAKFPSHSRSVKRLKKAVRPGKRKRDVEFTFEHLLNVVRPESDAVLALMLTDIAREGGCNRVVRVQSRETRGGLGDYSSVTEVPREIHDEFSDTVFEIQPDDLLVVYRFPRDAK